MICFPKGPVEGSEKVAPNEEQDRAKETQDRAEETQDRVEERKTVLHGIDKGLNETEGAMAFRPWNNVAPLHGL